MPRLPIAWKRHQPAMFCPMSNGCPSELPPISEGWNTPPLSFTRSPPNTAAG